MEARARAWASGSVMIETASGVQQVPVTDIVHPYHHHHMLLSSPPPPTLYRPGVFSSVHLEPTHTQVCVLYFLSTACAFVSVWAPSLVFMWGPACWCPTPFL